MRFLLLNQCFHPDVVSSGQHLTDLALALVADGNDVTVLTSSRAYDEPSIRFPRRERWNGIEVIRVASLGFGKRAKWRRAADFASLMVAYIARLVRLGSYDVVLAMTSPPLISVVGAAFAEWRRSRFVFWCLDLNPDEAVAAGWLRADSLTARILARMLHYGLRSADTIVALDRFMKQRLISKGVPAAKIAVVPPWSHDDAVRYDAEGRRSFREAHGLSDKFVVMYSGNHSPCHPLDTILEATLRLRDEPRVCFAFIGGGSEFKKVSAFVRQHDLSNVLCMPYQPRERLAASLSSADMHLIVMGDGFAGIIHPCKIYNILAVGAPVLYVGPHEGHVVDIASQLGDAGAAFVAQHGEVARVTSHILHASRNGSRPGGQRAMELANDFSQRKLVGAMIKIIREQKENLGECN